MQKILLLSAFIFVIIIGCSSAPETTTENKDVTFLTNGIWLGMLPCADCDGIDYQLNLKNDFTFKQKLAYKGKSEELFIDEGSWDFVSDSIISIYGSEETKLFLITSVDLILLDEEGNRIESSFEEKYHLHKDPGTVKESKELEPTKEVTPVVSKLLK